MSRFVPRLSFQLTGGICQHAMPVVGTKSILPQLCQNPKKRAMKILALTGIPIKQRFTFWCKTGYKLTLIQGLCCL
jgi:hypothetical protein